MNSTDDARVCDISMFDIGQFLEKAFLYGFIASREGFDGECNNLSIEELSKNEELMNLAKQASRKLIMEIEDCYLYD